MFGEGNFVGIFGIGFVIVDCFCLIRVFCGWDDFGICIWGCCFVGLCVFSWGCIVWCSVVEVVIELGVVGVVYVWVCVNG